MSKTKITCEKHPETELVCVKCLAAKGGLTRARRHGTKQLSEWGKKGGRPKTKQ
jgi:hypothetical protein